MTVGSDDPVEASVVRVVPDVPAFSVDDGFAYAVPDGMVLGTGDLVRVPLGGRRVRGWVTGVDRSADRSSLKEVLGRSGDVAVFDRRLLGVLRWVASHYVAPLATVLAKATPPNLPRLSAAPQASVEAADGSGVPPSAPGPAPRRVAVWFGPGPWAEAISDRVASVLGGGGSALVVAPSFVEAEEIAGTLAGRFGQRVVLASSRLPAADSTRAWILGATRTGTVVVGTRDVALWPVTSLALAVAVGEGRRGMKDKATPTVHARDVLYRRALVENFGLVLCDPVPTAEALIRASVIEAVGAARPWGLVEIVDRRSEPPGMPLLGATASAAMRAAVGAGKRVLLFTHRRTTAQRCVSCRSLRACAQCGAAPGVGLTCARCGSEVGPCPRCGGRRFEMLGSGVSRLAAEAGRIVGSEAVGEPGSGRSVVVGTERDLPGLSVDLSIVADGDGPIMAPTYRAAEDGLRLLGRVAGAAGRGRGRRAVVQTMQPDHPTMVALRRGDPVSFVASDAARRAQLGFPPGGELLVVEAAGLPDEWVGELATEIGGRATVLGPAAGGDRRRWLLQGRDLAAARVVLRSLVGRWREGGVRVRVDADPLDL